MIVGPASRIEPVKPGARRFYLWVSGAAEFAQYTQDDGFHVLRNRICEAVQGGRREMRFGADVPRELTYHPA